MNVENRIELVREAAQDDFLWGLGMRAPSAAQVRKFCQAFQVDLANEKRIKAVLKLREDDPQALRGIRDDAADEGEKTMPEVMYGPGHYEQLGRKKDVELWKKIVQDLEILPWDDIHPKVRSGEIREQEELPSILYAISYDMKRGGVEFIVPYMAGVTSSLNKPNIDFGENGRGPVIRVRPARYYPLDHGHGRFVLFTNPEELMTTSFFVDTRACGDLHPSRRNRYWQTAIVCVENRRFLKLAQRIAHAYEAETARRRKPAKAVVLKNY